MRVENDGPGSKDVEMEYIPIALGPLGIGHPEQVLAIRDVAKVTDEGKSLRPRGEGCLTTCAIESSQEEESDDCD